MSWGERFWRKIRVTDGCWLWTGYVNDQGYGVVRIGTPGRLYRAHRVVYEALRGPIPDGHELDHVKARGCLHRNCVNPDHLEPVTHLENVRRGDWAKNGAASRLAKTHCKHGHPFDEANTHHTGKQRKCRTCCRERQARYVAERKAAA